MCQMISPHQHVPDDQPSSALSMREAKLPALRAWARCCSPQMALYRYCITQAYAHATQFARFMTSHLRNAARHCVTLYADSRDSARERVAGKNQIPKMDRQYLCLYRDARLTTAFLRDGGYRKHCPCQCHNTFTQYARLQTLRN